MQTVMVPDAYIMKINWSSAYKGPNTDEHLVDGSRAYHYI